MPLPSVLQGVQDCRLPALKPPKRFQPSRRPPRQQLLLLQLHAPAICFSGGSRLPLARPQSPQTLPTLPQASKATTLTATTCPCHLFFRGFKTAVCPPSNPPNASNPPAGLQGNNSYSYMPLPSVFQGVQDCRLPALKPPKRFRRPPRQQLLQLYMPLPSVFQGVQDCRLPALKPPKRFRRPPRQQLLLQLRRPPRQQLLQLLHAPAICFSGGSRLPFARPQTPQTLPTLSQASKATTLTATCPCHLFFRGFKTAVCPPSNPPNASAGLQGNNSYSYMPLPSVFQGVQDCRLPALKPPKRFRRPPRQQLLQLHAPAICFSGGSRLPFARPQTPQTLPQASKATTLTATCLCHLFFRGFKTAVCPPSNPPNTSNPPAGLLGNNSYSYMPLPSVFQGVQDCRLPALKPPKRFQPSRRPPRQQLLQQQLLQLHAPAICSSGGSRLPFARPQTPQTLPQASKATTLTATCPCHLFFRGFKTAVCPPSIPPNASNPPAGLQGNNSYSYYMPLPSVFQGVQDCRLPALKPPKRFQPSRRPPRQQLLQLLHAPAICFSGGSRLPFARPQTPQTLPTLPQASKATTLTATCPCHLFFRGFKTAVCPPSNPPNASAGLQGNNSCPCHLFLQLALPQASKALPTCLCHQLFQGVQDCRLPALKPPKLFFRGFKTAVPQAPPSNPPNASGGSRLPFAKPSTLIKRSAGLQGNNSYSLQLHAPAICFSGGSRLPFARPQTPQTLPTLRRPPRQQLLQLHAPAICFSGGSRLPFARPQTPQTLPTLPQASKATTLTATCPCHLFFRGFKTAVCPPSNPPNASAGLQGNNSYSYMPLPSVFQGVQDCRLPALKPPKRFRRPPRQQLLHSYYSYMPLPSVFQGVQDCRLPALKPPKRFRRPPRQQLLQLHAPAICFSGGSRLPFARPQSPQTLPTLPQASKATTLTATTCPCHLFFRGFKTAVCPPSNPPNASNPPAGLQGNNSYSYMPLPSVFQGVQDCRLPALKPPKRFQPSRRPPRQQLLQLHAPAICFSGGSRLPFARPQTPQTLPQASKATTLITATQASKATTLTATTCPCHLFFRGFKTAVCPPSNPPNASNPLAGLQGNNSYSYMPLPSVFQGVQDCRLPALKPPKRCQPSAGLQGNNSYSYYMPLPSVFQGVQDCRLPALKPPKRFRRPPRQQLLQLYMPLPSVFQGVQDARRLPALKPPKRFRRPPRQQLLQLHAPAICFCMSGPVPASHLKAGFRQFPASLSSFREPWWVRDSLRLQQKGKKKDPVKVHMSKRRSVFSA